MSTKHTPGPWMPYSNSALQRIATGKGKDIATVHCGTKEWLANAAFIVRACNNHEALLAALQRLVIWDECGTSDDAVLDSIMSEARAAIAACEVHS